MNLNLKKVAIATISAGVFAGAVMASAQATASCFQFTQNMKLGSSGAQVLELQKTLNAGGYTISTSGVGSAGMETTYFGAKTKAAVIKFQAANNIINTGNVYALTRAALNANCTVVPPTGTTTTTQSGPVTVALASVQPNRVLIAGETSAKLADVVFSGNGTVVNVKLLKVGISNSDTLSNVYLYDGNVRLTDGSSVSNDGSVSWNVPSGIFSVNGSKVISVRADVALTSNSVSTSGQSVGFSLVGYTTMGNPAAMVSGVNGPALPIGSAQLATLTLGTNTSITGTNLSLPQLGMNVWGSQVNVSQRSVALKSLTLKMIGSAPITAIANAKLFIDGVQEGNAASVDANQRITFASTRVLSTGSHNVEVRADVVAGSNRNFYFTLENAADISATDSNFTDVNATLANYVSGSKLGATQNIGYAASSTIVIEKSANFSPTNVATGTTSFVLGSYRFAAYGEATKFQYITVQPTLASTTQSLTNVALYVDGAQVGSSYTITSGGTREYSLGSNFIAQPGVSYTVTVKADLVSSNGENVIGTASVALTNVSGIGQESQNSFSITPSTTNPTVTIGGGSPSAGKTVGAVNANISANSPFTLASYTIQGGSIEGITVRSITLALAGSVDLRNISSLHFADQNGATLGDSGIAQSSQSYTVNIPLAVGETKKIVVTATLGSATALATITPTLSLTYYNSSNQSYTLSNVAGDTLTVKTIVVGTPTVSSKLSAQTFSSGINGATKPVITYNATSSNGTALIKNLTFTIAGSGVSSLTIGSKTANVVGTTAMFSGLDMTIPSGNNGVAIPVMVNYAPAYIGSGVGSPSGSTSTVALTGAKIIDAAGNETNPTYSGLVSNAMKIVTSVPTVNALASTASLGVNGSTSTNVKIGSITVKADANGDVVVGKLSYSLNAPAAVSSVVIKVDGAVAKDVADNASTNTTTTATFAAGYRITAGSQKTFDVYASVAPVTTSGSLSVTLGDGSNFLWSDDTASAGTTYSGTELSSTNYNN